MHDTTLLRGLVMRTLDELRGKFEGLSHITISVGEADDADKQKMQVAFEQLRKEIPQIGTAMLTLEKGKAQAVCNTCGERYPADKGGQCPECGSTTVEMLQGDEIRVTEFIPE